MHNNNELNIIQQTLEDMMTDGFMSRGSGHCFSMSDMIQKLLYKQGIKSELIECSLMVFIKDPPILHFIGYHGMMEIEDRSKQMENHIVCLTHTEVPYLIDLSTSYIDPHVPYVCIPITKEFENTNLVEHDFGTSVWTYQQKVDSELPILHQKSILQRINTDKNVHKDIQFLKKIILAALTISSLNFIRGSFDFYQKYVVEDNNYGPNKVMVDSNK
jgi:hypothetical protein